MNRDSLGQPCQFSVPLLGPTTRANPHGAIIICYDRWHAPVRDNTCIAVTCKLDRYRASLLYSLLNCMSLGLSRCKCAEPFPERLGSGSWPHSRASLVLSRKVPTTYSVNDSNVTHDDFTSNGSPSVHHDLLTCHSTARKENSLGAIVPVNKHLREDRQIHAFETTSNLHDIRNPLRDFTPA